MKMRLLNAHGDDVALGYEILYCTVYSILLVCTEGGVALGYDVAHTQHIVWLIEMTWLEEMVWLSELVWLAEI